MIPFILLLAVGALLWAGSNAASSPQGNAPVGGPGTTTPFIVDKQGTTWFPLSPELLQSVHSIGATPLAPLLRTRLHEGQSVAVTFTSNGGITAIGLGGVIRSVNVVAPSPDIAIVYYGVDFQTLVDTTLLGSTPMPTFAFPIGFNVKASDVFDTIPPTVHSGMP